MIVDHIVLAGGRSARLGGRPKAELRPLGSDDPDQTLVRRTVHAVRTAGRGASSHGSDPLEGSGPSGDIDAPRAGCGAVVVVGPEHLTPPPDPASEAAATRPLPATASAAGQTPSLLLHAREDPPFSGPVAGIVAGLGALARVNSRAPWTGVWACDMPGVAAAVDALLTAAAAPELPEASDGVIAVAEDGHRENLAVVIRTDALEAVLAGQDGVDRSVRSVWTYLELHEIPVPAGSTADVDTWEDVDRFHLH